MSVNSLRPMFLILLVLSSSSLVFAGWERFDRWEARLLPDNPIQMEQLSTLAVYTSLALPLPDIIMGEDPLYDGFSYTTALAFSYGTKELIKHISGRTRPDGSDSLSFPSGHATGSAAALGYLLYMNQHRDYTHPAYLYVSIPLQVLTGSGRVLSRNHYPTDVIAGFAIGFSLGYCLPMAMDAIFNK